MPKSLRRVKIRARKIMGIRRNPGSSGHEMNSCDLSLIYFFSTHFYVDHGRR